MYHVYQCMNVCERVNADCNAKHFEWTHSGLLIVLLEITVMDCSVKALVSVGV